MTDIRTENLKMCIEKIFRVKTGQELLVIADDYVRPMALARDVVDLAKSMGIEAVLAVMKTRLHHMVEPPRTVAAAMKVAGVIVQVSEYSEIIHSNARIEAAKAGARFVFMLGDNGEDYLRQPFSLEDLNKIKERTDKVMGILAKGKRARVSTPYGTDLTMSIEGRPGRNLHPLSDYPVICAPDFAEASVAPVEGTTEGVVVINSSFEGWNYLLPKPVRYEVKKGRAQVDTVASDIPEQAERFREIVTLDEMASNCAAELGIGTNHLVKKLLGNVWDTSTVGMIHVAVGRNIDMGGTCVSIAHQDGLMTEATVKVDDILVVENGELKV